VDEWKADEMFEHKTNKDLLTEKRKIPSKTTTYRIDINWLNANSNFEIEKGEAELGFENFYTAACPNGVTNVKTYKEIKYKNIYNGIDLKWYQKNGALEYDFILQPGADPKKIQLEILGAEKISINKKGELEIKTPIGTIIEKAPVAYQNKKNISCSWEIKGNTVSFKLANYDTRLSLIIDPVVRLWGTYYGGTGIEYGYGCATDASGNVYTCGFTQTTISAIIATAGAHQTTSGGGTNDSFLAKFNTNGTRLWATFYGGGGLDVGTACATDALGNVIMSGYTDSNIGIASAGSHQSSLVGDVEAFLVKFNSLGVRQWGTYYADVLNEYGYGCAFDGSGNAYLCGFTTSAGGSLIATAGSHQATMGGGIQDGFLVKFNSAGVRQWGTYYGGAGEEIGNACTTDASGNVFITGETASATSTIIASLGTQQSNYGGGLRDAFVAKFNTTGQRQWGTYYGGTGDDYGYTCALDYYGNLLVAGSAGSATGISTAGAHQTTLSGTVDGFLTNFNSLTGVRNWGTYYGGTGLDYSRGCAVDNNGYIYMAGFSASSGGTAIATAGSYQSGLSGLNDGFLVQFTDCPSTTVTIVGTNSICSGQTVTLSATGTGFTNYLWSTSSTNTVISPLNTTIYSVTAGSGPLSCNATHSFSLSVTPTPTVILSPSSTTLCTGNTVTLSANGASTYSWNTTATTSVITVSPMVNTTYSVTGYNGTCSNLKTQLIQVTASTTLFATVSSNTICSSSTVTLFGGGSANTYSWSTGSTNVNIAVSPSVTTTYSLTGTNANCVSNTATINVSVTPTPTLILNSSTSSVCVGGSATLTANGASTYSWNTAATTPSIVVSPSVATNYTVIGYNGSCIDTKTTNIGIATNITVGATSNTTSICSGSSATLSANGASSYTWSNASNSPSTIVSPTASSVYTVNGSSGFCFGTGTINITVNPSPTINSNASSTIICVGESATITASGGNTYLWNTSSNANSTNVTPASTTNYTVTGYTSLGCSNNAVVTISVSACTGIRDLSFNNELNIYPNPASDKIIIETTFNNYTILVYDILGKLILENKTNVSKTVFNVNEFAKGVYTIKLYAGDISIVKKSDKKNEN
jgi:hypothetical protein